MAWVRYCQLFQGQLRIVSIELSCLDESPPLPPGDHSAVMLRNTESALTRMSESAGGEWCFVIIFL